ncbi:MAG TPA: hypothetical protein DCE73_12665 [Paraprevotella xylaniphila]|nr:hypothetical protein [Paraprevotella xylaniphila]
MFYRSLCSGRIKWAVLFFRKERRYIAFAEFGKRDVHDVIFIEKMPLWHFSFGRMKNKSYLCSRNNIRNVL